MVGVAAIVPRPATASIGYAEGHEVLTTCAEPNLPLIYYVGAGWSKLDFPNASDWQNYVSGFAARLTSPLRVTIH
jgi:hypothetical protein